MDPLSIISLVLRYGPSVVSLITQAVSNDDLTTKLKNLSAPLADLLETIGSNLFPKAAPTLHIVAGALASFNPDLVKWTQAALNTLLTPSPALVVDGKYGKLTRAAVAAFQQQHGLKVDELAGALTQAAIDALLASRPQLGSPAPATP